MKLFPKVKHIEAIDPLRLAVTFESGAKKIYNCESQLQKSQFQLLRTFAFFKAVRIDTGGYDISWNDDMDLSGWDLWIGGEELV